MHSVGVLEADCGGWAHAEFGRARLGDVRRTRRLIKVATRAAERPAGTVTEVFSIPKEREAAYRMLEGGYLSEHWSDASHQACAARGIGEQFLIVPTDETGLSFSDVNGKRGMGSVGSRKSKGRGVKAMTAIGLQPDGTPLGVLGQQYWRRPLHPAKRHHNMRPIKDKETQKWLDVMMDARSAASRAGFSGPLWHQHDRGGDFKEAFDQAKAQRDWLTARAKNNRRLAGAERRYLREELEEQPVATSFLLYVPPAKKRRERVATIEVRFCKVTIQLRDHRHSSQAPRKTMTLGAVLAREVETTPAGEKPIDWLLLTTAPLEDVDDALWVIHAYSLRWRVEDFHRCWKSVCQVEDSQLDALHIESWAAILAAVAMRIERLKYLARNEPATPATAEFSRDEIDAAILLQQPRGFQPGDTPTIAQMVQWIAQEGGYTGKSSGGPPGDITMQRGLDRITPLALGLRLLRLNGRLREPTPDAEPAASTRRKKSDQ